MTIRTFFFAATAWLFAVSAWGQGVTTSAVARIGKVELSATAMEKLVQSLAPEVRKQILEKPEALNELVKSETFRAAVLQEALKAGADQQETVIFQVARMRDQVIVDYFMQQRSELPANYPSEKEIEAAYESNKEQLKTPVMINMAQILLRGPMEAPKEFRLKQLARATEAHKRLVKGEDFAAVVRDFSDDDENRNRGGDLGWVKEADIFPLIRMEIVNLPAGGFSKPVRTQFGWQIVKIVERRTARAIPLAEARASLVASMRKTQKERIQAQYLKAIETNSAYEANADEVRRLRAKIAQ